MTDANPQCPIVDCMRPECRSRCGTVSWFGNLSDCDVSLQFQMPGGIWHSLGTYPPGMHTELGGGALLLPESVNLRVIETPEPGHENDATVHVVQDWGRLGPGLPSLYIDNSMCTKLAPSATAALKPAPPPVARTIAQRPPTWLMQSAWILAALAVILVVWLVSTKRQNFQPSQ